MQPSTHSLRLRRVVFALLLSTTALATTSWAQDPPSRFRCSNGYLAPSHTASYRISGRVTGCESRDYVVIAELHYRTLFRPIVRLLDRQVPRASDGFYTLNFDWCEDIAEVIPNESTDYDVVHKVIDEFTGRTVYERTINSLIFPSLRGDVTLPTDNCDDMISIGRLYATQAVAHNTATLVKGRRTVARIVARAEQDFGTVRAHAILRGYRNGVELPGSPLLPQNNSEQGLAINAVHSTSDRDDSALRTWNFLLPLSWRAGDEVTLVGVIDPDNELGECETCQDNNVMEVTAQFETGRELVVQPYQVTVAGRAQPDYSVEQIQRALEGTKHAFPYQIMTVKPIKSMRVDPDVNIDDVLDEMLCKACSWFGLSCGDTYHIAFLRTDTLEPYDGGKPKGIAQRGKYAAVSNADPMVAAHELGHAIGRKHAPGGGTENVDGDYPYEDGRLGQTGFNPYTMTAHPHFNEQTNAYTRDVMAYGNQRWISDYTWKKLFDSGFSRALPNLTGSKAKRDPKVIVDFVKVAFVRGLLGPDGVRLQPVWVQEVPTVLIPPADTSGEFDLIVKHEDGRTVRRRSFTPELPPHSSDGYQIFDAFVEFPGGSAEIQVYDNIELRTLATKRISTSPPVVITLPTPTDPVDGEGEVTIEWEASDPDGDETLAWVQFSADGGRSWENLGLDLTGSSLTVPATSLKGTDNGRIRVSVTDGLRTTTVESKSILRVADMPPAVSIVEGTEMVVNVGDLVQLTAIPSDREDESFPEEKIIWTIERRELGRGRTLEIVPTEPGEHVITLFVTDTSNQTATAEFVLTVIGETVEEGGRQLPGDANQDGNVDLSDSLSVLGTLFIGSPDKFPCGDGSASAIGNVALLDWNGDASVNLSDAVASLTHLFAGGPGHVLGSTRECAVIEGCADLPTCGLPR